MLIRMASIFRFYTGVTLGLILATVVLGLAIEQRWLGLRLSPAAAGGEAGVRIESLAARGLPLACPPES